MPDTLPKLIAAASQTAAVTSDLIEAISDGEIRQIGNIHSGDTTIILADGLRLLIEATSHPREHQDHDEDAEQLLGALVRFLEDRT